MDASLPPPSNTLGALVFIAYIVLALLLTSLITTTLYHRYTSLPTTTRATRPSPATLWPLLLISLTSFTTLSWHMSRFLIASYLRWCALHHVPPPSSWPAALFHPTTLTHQLRLFWRWSTSSTLFRDFAVEIASSQPRLCWTSLALWWELGVAWWMAHERNRRHLSGSWMYFALAQILPISFAQSLFSLHLLLDDAHRRRQASVAEPGTVQQQEAAAWSVVRYVSPFLYSVLLHEVPQAVAPGNETTLVAVIFALRLVLLAPYFVISPESSQRSLVFLLPVALGDLSVKTMALWNRADVGLAHGAPFKLWSALGEGHAVAALGWDVIVAAASLAVYSTLKMRQT